MIMNKNINLILLAIAWLGMINLSYAQNIVQAEYYINADPGPGNATAVSFTSSDSVSHVFALDVSGLDLGMHVLFMRVRQDNGLWSLPQKRHFYVMDTTTRVVQVFDGSIYAAEYFVDQDPGIGNGTRIDFASTKSANENFSLTVTDQEPGLHYLFLRAKQDDGLWSVVEKVPFYVIDTTSQDVIFFRPGLVAAEYFFDEDPGPGNGKSIPIQKDDSISHRPWTASTEGLEVGRHYLYLRVQSEDGLWNTVTRKEVFISDKGCNLPVADFAFDTVSVNTNIGLTDLSTNVDASTTYEWDVFADDVIDSESPTFDTLFSKRGVYPVKLTVRNSTDCFTSKVKDVYVTDGFPSAISSTLGDSIFVDDTTTLTAPSGYAYKWSTGDTIQSIDVDQEGLYYVWLSDGNITYRSKKLQISVFEHIQATINTIDASSAVSNGVARLEGLTTDGLPYSITWSTGVVEEMQVTDLAAGSYSVTVATALESMTYNFTIGTVAEPFGILAAEYFMNSDPGPGNGIPLNIPQNSSISYSMAVPTDSLRAGIHRVFIRARQDNGLWGIPVAQTFYVIDSTNSGPAFNFGGDIIYAEYTIDTMPSTTTATPISLSATSQRIEESFAVDISTLTLGEHTIYIRSKDSNGNWSFEKPLIFNVCNSVPINPVPSDTLVCKGLSFYYSIESTDTLVNWYDDKKQLIKSSADDNIYISNVQDSTLYYVAIENAEGCESALVPFVVDADDPQIYAGADRKESVYLDTIQITSSIPSGGIWTGNSFITSNGKFSPSNAGLGTFEVTYSYDTLNCTATDNMIIEVVDEQVQTYPDLIVDSSGFNNINFRTSDLFKVSTNVLNQGNGDLVSAFNIEYFMSSDPVSSADDYLLTTVGVVDTIVSSASVFYNASFNIPDTTHVGSYYLITYLDHADNAVEEVEDNNAYAIEFTVKVNQAPIAADQVFAIDENMPQGTLVGVIEASDPEGDNLFGQIISGNETNAFHLVDTTGVLSVADSAQFDFETNPYFTLSVMVSDGVEPDTAIVTVNVNDVFENVPPVMADQIFAVNENMPAGTVIGSLAASDENGDSLTFNIVSGNETAAFGLNQNELIIVDSAQFDFESVQSFALTLTVADGMENDTANVTVNIIDVQELDPLEADSLALIALYDSTGGTQWLSSINWLTDDVSTWEGITVLNGRVSEIKLASNGLVGNVPADITTLDSLSIMNLSGNDLISLPDFSGMASISSVDVSGNKLMFDALEANANIPGIVYSPQDSIGAYEYVMLPVHSDTTLSINIGGTANHYQWFYNGLAVGPDSSIYNIANLDRTTMGRYSVDITNDLVPGLTISYVPDDIYAGATLSGMISDNEGKTVAGGGEVILLAIRSQDGYDTLEVKAAIQQDGSYSFDEVLLQDYIAISTIDTLEHPDLLDTYYSQAIFWEEADTIFLETNSANVDIIMVAYTEQSLGGEGVISGYIEELIEESSGGKLDARGRRRVSKARVSIRRGRRSGKKKLIEKSKMLEEAELVDMDISDQEGKFVFNNLLDDVYYLNVQYPGYPMDENSFIAIPIGDAANGRVVDHKDKVEVEALVAENRITVKQINVTHVYADEAFVDIRIYPNPASSVLNIDMSAYSLDFDLRIYDLNGKEVIYQEDVSGKLHLNLSELNRGLYYLKVFSEDQLGTTFKLVVE